MALHDLTIAFEARGQEGEVRVAVAPNADPSAVGSPDWAQGFPVCQADISWDAVGYRALLGWVQLVGMGVPRSAEPRTWAADPLEVYEGLNTPFGFYGLSPTLFDAPARRDRSQALDWHAESFLCVAPSAPMAREAFPVAAFSWGFTLDNGIVSLTPPAPIDLAAWGNHVALLESQYPGWTFGAPA